MKKGPGLYIHIPFCKKKCGYCDFVSFPVDDVGAYCNTPLTDQYLAALAIELDALMRDLRADNVGAYCNTPRRYFPTIYIGGGTPTVLTDDQLLKLGGMIDAVRAGVLWGDIVRAYCNTPRREDPEFTIECNPGTITPSKLNILKQIGVNRLSIGCQSFDDDELKTLGRMHSSKEIYESFEAARAAGFDNINLDLIFAIPGQTPDSWMKTLEQAIKLDPEHISAYNLQIEEGTPFWERYGGGRDFVRAYSGSVQAHCNAPLPDNDAEYNMYASAIDLLKSLGYIHYEISNFAKPGRECLHNINYWENGDYISAGLNASSHLNGKRYQNTAILNEYISNPAASRIEEQRGDRAEIAETMFMGLRMLKGVDTQDFEKRFGAPLRSFYQKEIESSIEKGLLEVCGSRLRLTQKGLFVANEAFQVFV